jgi:hypothetical protein
MVVCPVAPRLVNLFRFGASIILLHIIESAKEQTHFITILGQLSTTK